MCAVLSCVHTMTRLPVLRIFNVRSNVDARDCTPSESVCAGLGGGRRGGRAIRNRTRVNTAPGFWV